MGEAGLGADLLAAEKPVYVCVVWCGVMCVCVCVCGVVWCISQHLHALRTTVWQYRASSHSL